MFVHFTIQKTNNTSLLHVHDAPLAFHLVVNACMSPLLLLGFSRVEQIHEQNSYMCATCLWCIYAAMELLLPLVGVRRGLCIWAPFGLHVCACMSAWVHAKKGGCENKLSYIRHIWLVCMYRRVGTKKEGRIYA